MELSELECFDALSDRVIDTISFETAGEEAIIIETKGGLAFRIGGGNHYSDENEDGYVSIEQVAE